MSLLALIKGRRGKSGFGFASTAEEVTEGLDLTGKRVLITGINSGLGYASGCVLARRGAHVIGAARTVEKAKAACSDFGNDTTAIACELSEPESVRACVAELASGPPLDVLLCNAGIMALPELTLKHDLELQFLTNHIGHFILVTGLLDTLADDGRVVMLSSSAHRFTYKEGVQLDNLSGQDGYSGFRAYGQSKLANILFTKELARRLASSDRTVNAVHPGGINTNLGRHMNKAWMLLAGPLGLIWNKNIPQGAATECYVAAHPALAATTGEYFEDCNSARPSDHALDPELATRLWAVSEEIVAGLS